MRNYIYLTLCIGLLSCSDNEKIARLENDNNDLKKRITQLEDQISSYKYEAFVIPLETEILVGDTFFAVIGLAAYDTTNHATAVLGTLDYDSWTLIPNDTIPFNQELNQSWLSIPANEPGNYGYTGAVYQTIDGKQNEYLFKVHYTVKPR